MTKPTPTPPWHAAGLEIEAFVLGPYETNCYLVRRSEGRGCWIFDAGFEPGELIERVRALGLTPRALLLTHAHADHIAGVSAVVSAFPGTPVWIHREESRWLSEPELNLSAFMGRPVTCPGPDRGLDEGETLEVAGLSWRVLHVPGHSPGSAAFHCAAAGVAVSGDALFAGSIGRTDFPGCSFEALERSIREKLYTLPGATVILPGHGPSTTIAREKLSNPYVRG
jgi:glyoxylase-like metal-dependent hydrolase (beta-lactamase superfamily II)